MSWLSVFVPFLSDDKESLAEKAVPIAAGPGPPPKPPKASSFASIDASTDITTDVGDAGDSQSFCSSEAFPSYYCPLPGRGCSSAASAVSDWSSTQYTQYDNDLRVDQAVVQPCKSPPLPFAGTVGGLQPPPQQISTTQLQNLNSTPSSVVAVSSCPTSSWLTSNISWASNFLGVSESKSTAADVAFQTVGSDSEAKKRKKSSLFPWLAGPEQHETVDRNCSTACQEDKSRVEVSESRICQRLGPCGFDGEPYEQYTFPWSALLEFVLDQKPEAPESVSNTEQNRNIRMGSRNEPKTTQLRMSRTNPKYAQAVIAALTDADKLLQEVKPLTKELRDGPMPPAPTMRHRIANMWRTCDHLVEKHDVAIQGSHELADVFDQVGLACHNAELALQRAEILPWLAGGPPVWPEEFPKGMVAWPSDRTSE